MKKYYNYLKYIIEHKKNVFIECWDAGLYLHAFTHDLSKLLPDEFFPYANKFYGKVEYDEIIIQTDGKPLKTLAERNEKFEKAWKLHYGRNKHHPEHWLGRNMPLSHVKEMVCDLKAMSRKFGGTAKEYYMNNFDKWDMTPNTRVRVHIVLKLSADEHVRVFNSLVYKERFKWLK